MENRSAERRLKKKDIVFLGILILIAAGFLLWFLLGYQKKGMEIEVTVDGNLYGIYSLSTNQEIPIRIQDEVTNVLVIQDGKADMVKAKCPDQICVNHVPVSHAGESIVCLPNRIVVNVAGEETSEMDAVAK